MMAVEESPQSLASVKSPCNLQLEQLVRTHGGDDASLADLRLLFIVLVGYAGFLRISEILAMQVKHIEFLPEGMSIYLPKRKNDQFRLGSKVFIARSNNITCPVAISQRLLAILPDGSDSSNLVVRRIKLCKNVKTFHESRGISYTTAKELIKKGLGVFYDDLSKLGTHSLRSGGASDPGCVQLSDFALQRHGGWKCTTSKNKYIHPSKSQLFEVSSSLSL